jgi:predicted nucleic acid-binding protein
MLTVTERFAKAKQLMSYVGLARDKDVRVAGLLEVSSVEPLDERRARDAGALRRSVPGASTIDACIAVGAAQRGDAVATSDPHDMRQLLGSNATILTV